MAVSSRKVQNKRDSNGVLTGKAGAVYDVNIKYTGQDGKKKSYAKKGFATKKEATQHEAEMKAKLANPIYSPVVASQGKQTVKEYLEEWVENHGKANLRPSTFAGYKSHIRNHIVPYIGHVQLNQLTPAMLDNMFQQLFDKGLSNSTVRYAQRIFFVFSISIFRSMIARSSSVTQNLSCTFRVLFAIVLSPFLVIYKGLGLSQQAKISG